MAYLVYTSGALAIIAFMILRAHLISESIPIVILFLLQMMHLTFNHFSY